MSFDRDDPSDAEVCKWFLQDPPVPERTFELALVLGGTVSAGAYTAGAVDFLIEALDRWTEQRAADPSVPQHNVVLRVITGTSGGGVIAAIAARALNYEFPHVQRSTPIADGLTGNPFYDVWIKQLTLGGFLNTSDLDDKLVSLLNGAPINEAANSIVQFTGPPKRRAWLAAPLRIILTLTNLRGVPYKVTFTDGLGETYVDHADHLRFAAVYPGQNIAEFRPDELTLGFDGASLPQALRWEEFGEFAKATAAFPVGFPPRALQRPTEHYRYRVVAAEPPDPAAPSRPRYNILRPDWDALEEDGDVPATYQFLCVDGGATDNEPIELARTALCGLVARNPRAGVEAKRAVILIDPFAGQADLGPKGLSSLVTILGGVSNALIEQTRYDSRDLVLAADEDVFSRFMITPQNGGVSGANAIASSGLGAFIGFACADFTRYDYLLGRKNCRDFLRKFFVLPAENPVFGGAWTPAQKAQFAPDAKPGNLPIIPLVGTTADEQELDAWPSGKLDPEIYSAAIKDRFRKIVEVGTNVSPLLSVVGRLGAASFQYEVAKDVIKLMSLALPKELDRGD
jgi:hypothetical protein